jgi:sec-independent protein translocase protein TatA
LGLQEGLVVVLVLLVLFGTARIPMLGDAVGRAIRNFKRALSGQNEIDVTDRSQVGPGEGDDPPRDEGDHRPG